MEPKYSQVTTDLENVDLFVANPRFDRVEDQRGALHAMCHDQGDKLVALAEDIVQSGVSPIDLPLVVRSEKDGPFIVVEGNRRVTTLKLLSQPTRIDDTPLTKSQKRTLKRLAAAYEPHRKDKITCVVARSMEDARHWVSLRHTGENKGAGVVAWDGAARARFRGNSPGYDVIEFVRGQLGDKCSDDIVDKFPVTNLERLLGDPDFRGELGLELKGGKLTSSIEPQTTAKNLYAVMTDLRRPDVTVGAVYTKGDRKKYIEKIRPHFTKGKASATPWTVDGSTSGASVGSVAGSSKTGVKRGKKRSATRIHLIPATTVFPVEATKADEICRELRRLDIRLYPFSVAVMARVFLEISVQTYIETKKLRADLANVSGKQDPTLKHKVTCVKQNLLANGAEKSAINAAWAKFTTHGSPLSIDQLHLVVHNPHFQPDSRGLISAWDTCEPFFVALWNAI